MKKRLGFWKLRNLHIKGRVLVLNALLLSKVWYVLSVTELPAWAEKEIRGMVTRFLWEGKPAKISYDTLIGQVHLGGLRLVDPELKKKSLRVKMVIKCMDESNTNVWKPLMAHYLQKCGGLNVGQEVLLMKLKPRMITGMPGFYREVLEAWGSILKHVTTLPGGRDQLLEQPLFLNPLVTENGRPLFNKLFIAAGVIKIKDVLYEVKTGFLPEQAMVDAISEVEDDIPVATICNYYSKLKAAVPREWVRGIDEEEIREKEGEVPLPGMRLRLKGRTIPLLRGTTKDFYLLFLEEAFKRPTAEILWGRLFSVMEPSGLWRNVRGRYLAPECEDLDFRLRHNCLFTNLKLSKMLVGHASMCPVCGLKQEGLLHVFLNCVEVVGFLEYLRKLVRELMSTGASTILVNASWDTIFMFGVWEHVAGANVSAINLILSYA